MIDRPLPDTLDTTSLDLPDDALPPPGEGVGYPEGARVWRDRDGRSGMVVFVHQDGHADIAWRTEAKLDERGKRMTQLDHRVGPRGFWRWEALALLFGRVRLIYTNGSVVRDFIEVPNGAALWCRAALQGGMAAKDVPHWTRRRLDGVVERADG